MPNVSALSLVEDLALTIFVVLWVVVGSGDLTHQKIRHRLMLYGTTAVAAAYLLSLALTGLGEAGWVSKFLLPPYYRLALSHLALCVFAALGLWKLGVWPAGDAKLFVLVGALYPLLDFASPLRYERVFLSALINTFLPAAAVLFLRACYYIYDTRLRHNFDFLRRLGWRRELSFIGEESLAQLRAALREARPALKGLWERLAADPRAAARVVLQWAVSMLGMALMSYYLKDFFGSPLKLTLLWTVLIMLWRRAVDMFGPLARVLLLLPVAYLLIFRPPSSWSEFALLFRNLTLFSFFMFLGMNWAMRMLRGGAGLPFLLPFMLPFLGIAVSMLFGLAINGARALLDLARTALAKAGPSGGDIVAAARGVSLSMPSAKPLLNRAASESRSLLSLGADAGGRFGLRTLLVICGMGLFFGLSLVLVRLWDQEVRPIRSRSTLEPYLVLSPAFVERVKEDREFFETRIGTLYPDGLTRDQADSLKEWCAARAIDEIPLTPTMSFAAWIFLGFFLAHLLSGGHVLEAIF